jgi:hypothetical protein
MKANTTTEDRMYHITSKEKTSNQRVALIWLHTTKSLNNKNSQMAGITTQLSILALNNRLNSPIKTHHLANWIKRQICCLQETHLIDRNKQCLKVKGWKKIYQANGPPKARVAILRFLMTMQD